MPDSVKAHHMGVMDPIVGCCYRWAGGRWGRGDDTCDGGF